MIFLSIMKEEHLYIRFSCSYIKLNICDQRVTIYLIISVPMSQELRNCIRKVVCGKKGSWLTRQLFL